jgi:hypothetical protein
MVQGESPRLKSWEEVSDDNVVYECRMYGARAEPTDWQCPNYGSIEIAEYEFSTLE